MIFLSCCKVLVCVMCELALLKLLKFLVLKVLGFKQSILCFGKHIIIKQYFQVFSSNQKPVYKPHYVEACNEFAMPISAS